MPLSLKQNPKYITEIQKISAYITQFQKLSNVRSQTKRILNVKSAKEQAKYLGMPLINGRVTKSMFNDLICKFDTKLNIWYLKFLSMTGRAVLINSTLQTMPFYSMAAFFIAQKHSP